MYIEALASAWDILLRWLRVMWVCRIGCLSAGLGMLLFYAADPARDLFLENHDYPLYWASYFALVLAWSIIVHYASRKVLEQQAWAAFDTPLPLRGHVLAAAHARYRLPAAWVPRILGLLCIVAVGIGLCGAEKDVRPIGDEHILSRLSWLRWSVYGLAVVYALYVFLRRRVVHLGARWQDWSTYSSEFVRGRDRDLLVEHEPFWFLQIATAAGRAARLCRASPAWDIAAIVLLGTLVFFWLVCVIWPGVIETVAPRAMFVVFVLGLPVTLLAFISMLSHQYRFPFLAITILGFTFLTGWQTPNFHDLRLLPEEARETVARPELTAAVDRWIRINCDLSPEAEAVPCGVHPIILASAGGASRAAFFTATVVGDMLGDERIDLRRRLFAMSGVSGGSVGSVMIRAALNDAPSDGTAPCSKSVTAAESWFGHQTKPEGPYSWKQCLQILTAGDFLSRPFIGLVFRDLFGYPLHYLKMQDRAVLLEEAFEDHYRSIVSPDAGPRDSLTQPLGASTGTAGRWMPLLLLNTTSVRDGRRSIASDLLPFRCKDREAEPLFPAAVDLHETLGAARGCKDGKPIDGAVEPTQAFSLSTAATASARFPILSPQAGIRRGDQLVDMLVDGGYFENDGLTTARELAEAISRVTREMWDDAGQLKPVIVHVTNNPTSESVGVVPVPQRGKLPEYWYNTFLAPFTALVGTRDGHAAEAYVASSQTFASVNSPNGHDPKRIVSFQVYDKILPGAGTSSCSLWKRSSTSPPTADADRIKNLSMSWWLSGTVQSYLDKQLCHPGNIESFERMVAMVGQRGKP